MRYRLFPFQYTDSVLIFFYNLPLSLFSYVCTVFGGPTLPATTMLTARVLRVFLFIFSILAVAYAHPRPSKTTTVTVTATPTPTGGQCNTGKKN